MSKVIIEIVGGIVVAAYTTSSDIELFILDHDVNEQETDQKKKICHNDFPVYIVSESKIDSMINSSIEEYHNVNEYYKNDD